MKLKSYLSGLLIVGLILIISCTNSNTGNRKLKSKMDTVNYCLGVDLGRSLESLGVEDFDLKLFTSAIEDILKGKNVPFNEASTKKILDDYFYDLRQKQIIEEMEVANKALEEGEQFLEENKKKEGVIETESGLQYIVLEEGNGQKPDSADIVKVHYHGTLTDGTVFDSSVDKGEPAEFGVTRVIKGWTEALINMKVGSKWKIFIHPKLAYGSRRRSEIIRPNAVLIFEMELLSIVEKIEEPK